MDSNLKFPEAIIVVTDASQDIEQNTINDCVICMDAMDKPDEVCKFQCGHIFHTECCNQFFDKLCIANLDITCPLCRVVLQENTTAEYIINRIALVQALPQPPARSPARIIHDNRNRDLCFDRIIIGVPLLILLTMVLAIVIWMHS